MPDSGNGTRLDELLALAQQPDVQWRIEGSSDWTKKPGRLTIWVDLPEDRFDDVYDTLNDESDLVSLGEAGC